MQVRDKRYFIIEKQAARYLCITPNIDQTRLPFYATQIINPFFTSIILTNHVKREKFQLIGKFLHLSLFL